MKHTLAHIQQRYTEGEVLDYLFFWGHQPSKDGRILKSCLSQWWMSRFIENNTIYKSAEHYMMEGKARVFNDPEIAKKIISADSPKKVKSLGREIKGFSDKVWDEHKYEIVKQANYLKFTQNEGLQNFLLNTEDLILVEASPVDSVWGVGMAEDDPNITNPYEWKGLNLLGCILMEIRDEINYINRKRNARL